VGDRIVIYILICIGAVLLGLAVFLATAFKIVRRGALTFEIDGFYTHVMDGDPGPIIREFRVSGPGKSPQIADSAVKTVCVRNRV